jgi:hypothetical protein
MSVRTVNIQGDMLHKWEHIDDNSGCGIVSRICTGRFKHILRHVIDGCRKIAASTLKKKNI